MNFALLWQRTELKFAPVEQLRIYLPNCNPGVALKLKADDNAAPSPLIKSQSTALPDLVTRDYWLLSN